MNKRIVIFIGILFIISDYLIAQNGNVGIGTQSPNNSAILDLDSQVQGFLPPRMNQQQRDAIQNPVAGLIIFNIDSDQLNYHDGVSWMAIGPKNMVTNAVTESIDSYDYYESIYTLTTDYLSIETATIQVDVPGTIVIMGELNVEPSNNANIICTFSKGADSLIPATSLSKHALYGNKASILNRNASFSVVPGSHVFNMLIRISPTPNTVMIGQYFSQITLLFFPD